MEKPSNLSQLFAFASSYAIFVSILHLLGYWNVFDINIFLFSSLSELLTTTIQKLVFNIFPLLIGAVIGTLMFESFGPPPGSADDSIKRFSLRNWSKICILMWILVLATAGFMPNRLGKWIGIAFFVFIPLIYLVQNTKLKKYFTVLGLRPAFLFFALWLPFLSFGWGSVEGHLMKTEKPYHISIKETPGVAYNLVGRGGQHIFLWQIDKGHLVIRRLENISEMVLNRRDPKE